MFKGCVWRCGDEVEVLEVLDDSMDRISHLKCTDGISVHVSRYTEISIRM